MKLAIYRTKYNSIRVKLYATPEEWEILHPILDRRNFIFGHNLKYYETDLARVILALWDSEEQFYNIIKPRLRYTIPEFVTSHINFSDVRWYQLDDGDFIIVKRVFIRQIDAKLKDEEFDTTEYIVTKHGLEEA